MTKREERSPDETNALEKLRAICAGLPECLETKTFGHPTFQAGKKRTFVVLDDHERPGMLCIVFKADRAEQSKRVDGVRFFQSKFGAKHGWTAMRVDAKADWKLAQRLIVGSFRLVALKRMIAALDAHETG
jgi:hypothetical protein